MDKEDSSKNVQGEPSSSPSPEVTNDAGSVKELLVKIRVYPMQKVHYQ